ncbi:hypothetical protein PVK06_001383 [Gossypium arboreum]|uniref:Uncharacterized protein n=1 Tax=Gossypium arboreum TaxID=29729 RepID=A0ABR0R1V6_GOSAR|nr:hypothetical protein PVK06_001383 [Gossypium arboreum]
MTRTRGSGRVAQNIPLRHREVKSPMEAKAYICTTMVEEMNQALVSGNSNTELRLRFFNSRRNVRGGPFGTAVGEGSSSGRKGQRTTSGIGNIISSKDKDSLIKKLQHKKRRDSDRPFIEGLYFHGESTSACKSFPSILMRRLQECLTLVEKEVEKLHGEIIGEQVEKSFLEATLKSMDDQHKAAMANLVKSHKEACFLVCLVNLPSIAPFSLS